MKKIDRLTYEVLGLKRRRKRITIKYSEQKKGTIIQTYFHICKQLDTKDIASLREKEKLLKKFTFFK